MQTKTIKVRVKAGAGDAYLKSGQNSYSSEAYRQEVAEFLRQREGKEFVTRPRYNDDNEIVAYDLDNVWALLPLDVDVISEEEGGE